MQYPPLERWQRYPVTVGIILGAVVMTAWTGFGENLARGTRWMMTEEFLSGEIWRPLTSCLMHGNIIHLIFNVMCLWVFGPVFEERFGSTRLFLIIIFLALGSSLAQYALSGGGIGLSGMIYGLFGLLWVLNRKDRRFFGTMDQQTIHMMVGWFFLCIVATIADLMAIANVAHGSGAILGAMLGYAIVEKDKRRKAGYAALIVISMLAIFAAASVGRKYVNFTGGFEQEQEHKAYKYQQLGYDACLAGKFAEAAEFYEKAVAIDDSHAGWWHNLGLCRARLGEADKAKEAFRREAQLKSQAESYNQDLQSDSPSD
jgi:GlpG protein